MFSRGLGWFSGPTWDTGSTPVAPQYGKNMMTCKNKKMILSPPPVHGSNPSQRKVANISDSCLVELVGAYNNHSGLGRGEGCPCLRGRSSSLDLPVVHVCPPLQTARLAQGLRRWVPEPDKSAPGRPFPAPSAPCSVKLKSGSCLQPITSSATW